MNAVVLGGGSWGTVFARLLRDRGHDVTLACRTSGQAHEIQQTGRNSRYVHEVDLTGIEAVQAPDAPLEEADVLVAAIPSGVFARVVAGLPVDKPVLSLTKGLDPATGERLSTVSGARPYALLSGPNFSREISAGLPAAAVIASEDEELAGRLQAAINSEAFRVYVNGDLAGVEIAGAAKNVIALAAGCVEGLGLGDNAKAAMITRGLAEMGRLGETCGARAETFSGLAGMGDLIATCWSRHSRNRRAGQLLALGSTPEEAAAEIGQVVEGLSTAPALAELARRAGEELPITDAVCRLLGGEDAAELGSGLMRRVPTAE